MQRILVASSKGGCGKTTLATNLAIALARRGRRVFLIDADPQGSGAEWHRARAATPPGVGLLHSAEGGSPSTAGWTLRVPPTIDSLVIDTPAGLRPHQLAEFLRRCDTLLVPIVPSGIDTRASSTFLAELAHAMPVRSGAVRVGLIANRVRARTIAARQLAEFTASFAFPLLATLRDSQAYVLAGALGRGVFDYAGPTIEPVKADWDSLLAWLRPALPAAAPALHLPAASG